MPTQNPWRMAGVANILRPGAAVGEVYFVDGNNGDDDGNGLSPTSPKRTITSALASCSDGGNDVIVVLDYPEAGDLETMPISITKARTHVVGAAWAHERSDKFIFLCCGTTDTAVFSIEARNVEIAYFKLAGGTDDPSIQFAGAGTASKAAAIHHCTFGQKNSPLGQPLYGIRIGPLQDGLANWCYIGYNFFGSSISSHGLYIDSNPAHIVVENNVFYRCGGDGINIPGGGNYGLFLDNQFACRADVQGTAITLTNTSGGIGNFFDGNSANYGKGAMVANPYEDSSIGAGNDWGMNHKANTHALPA